MVDSVPPADLHALIDPELRMPLEQFLQVVGPAGFFGISDLHARRERFEEIMAISAARGPDATRVDRQDFMVTRSRGAPPIQLRHYRSAGVDAIRPGIVYIHGGGMIMGSVGSDDGFAADLAESTGCSVISVGYGLAPENSGSGPVEDCYEALLWTAAHAKDLKIDAQNLALYGVSAGGGLACGTALLARDRKGPPIRCQILIYPMLDDRNETASSHRVTDLGIWDRGANIEAWSYLLGDTVGTAVVLPHVAPARATDLSGLPETYIDIGDLDLFLDETCRFARQLQQAAVPVEFNVYPGAYHGFDQVAYDSDLAGRARRDRIKAIARALGADGGTNRGNA